MRIGHGRPKLRASVPLPSALRISLQSLATVKAIPARTMSSIPEKKIVANM
jgi:hypothetical protein